jgi:hypothetical protein
MCSEYVNHSRLMVNTIRAFYVFVEREEMILSVTSRNFLYLNFKFETGNNNQHNSQLLTI